MKRGTLAKTLVVAGLFCASLLGMASPVRASEPLFYRQTAVGTGRQFSPWTMLINGGWDILRNPSVTDRIGRIAYATGHLNVADNLLHAPHHVSNLGLGRFVAHEVVPIRGLQTNYGQFVPNYFMHLLGEGMLYRMLSEYGEVHDWASPRLMALAGVLAMQWLNEAAENGSWRGTNQDPIADILLFNPLGILLFSFDGPAQFLSGPVQTHYWPGQASLMLQGAPNQWRLINQGENFAFHIGRGLPLGLQAFMYYGKQGLFGAAAPVGEDTLSLGVGPSLLGLSPYYERDIRIMLPGRDMQWEIGVFWDRDGSLLASAIATVVGPAALHVNVYPRALPGALSSDLGFFGRCSELDGCMGGVTWAPLPLGLGWSADKPNQDNLLR